MRTSPTPLHKAAYTLSETEQLALKLERKRKRREQARELKKRRELDAIADKHRRENPANWDYWGFVHESWKRNTQFAVNIFRLKNGALVKFLVLDSIPEIYRLIRNYIILRADITEISFRQDCNGHLVDNSECADDFVCAITFPTGWKSPIIKIGDIPLYSLEAFEHFLLIEITAADDYEQELTENKLNMGRPWTKKEIGFFTKEEKILKEDGPGYCWEANS